MRKLLLFLLSTAMFLAIVGAAGAVAALWYFSRDLPDHQQLADYQPAVMTRLHAGDGRVLAELATERRLFVPIDAIPKRVIQAMLSAEDKSFYSHQGVSVPDILRAAYTNLLNYGQRRPVGASTITQQVAKNFLLTNELSFQRKLKEAILAVRIEQVLSKDRILELYMNEIYLGSGSYGVAAAALNYFGKSLDEISTAEAAYLAALPKAPNNYNPQRFPEAAKTRRDWVIGRMVEDGFIGEAEATEARATPLVVRAKGEEPPPPFRADYFTEEVRRELLASYGEHLLYRGGLSVRTTLDPRMQEIAEQALRNGLIAYDRRHGWRGPLGHIEPGEGWQKRLAAMPHVPGIDPWQPAAVLALSDAGVEIGLGGGERGLIPMTELQWARPTLDGQRLGAAVRKPADVASVGDVVAVEALDAEPPAKGLRRYGLRQIPNVGGAFVALDPHTGRVLAMSGGFSYEISQFNRATQAMRQPGSSFKPFVYMAALDNGFTPASVIMDAPFVIDQGPGLGLWKPSNYSMDFLGPVPLRVGIEKSRNLMTVRLADLVGMDKVAPYAERLGVVQTLPRHLSMALGAGETTLFKMATAYGMIDNGGLKITPTLIDRIQDRNGRTIYRHDQRRCEGCTVAGWAGQLPPRIPDERERVLDPTTAFQMVWIMQGVVERGTAARLRALGRPLAGKTGTSNDANDTWFIGFSPDLVAGVFVGFDNPRTLGPRETGGSVAAPVVQEFFAGALKDKPATPFRIPPGIRLVRVNPETGKLAQAGDRSFIWEAFKPGTESLAGVATLDPNSDTPGAPGAAVGPAIPIPTAAGSGIY